MRHTELDRREVMMAEPTDGPRLTYVPTDQFEAVLSTSADRVARAELFATLCRINTLYMIQRAGSGHIGSSFSSLDIVTWLYLEHLREVDIYFSSKGHDVPGLYSVLIALGRLPAELLHRLRRIGGLPGHPDVGTPGVVTNTGSLGMGISKAKGFVRSDRLQGRERSVYVMTGDGELQEGQVWESLLSASNDGMSEICAIVDRNRLQSDTFTADVSDLGDIEAKFRAFGWSTARCNGHDFTSIAAALVAAPSDRPHAIVADTVKGRGVGFMEPHAGHADTEFYPFHSGAVTPDAYVSALEELQERARRLSDAVGIERLAFRTAEATKVSSVVGGHHQDLIGAYARALVHAGAADDTIVVFDADLVKDTGLADFRARFPDRFVECGIAEQDMVSQAGALASEGLRPVVHSFASFLSSRPNEQIHNNATQRSRVVYVGSLAGVIPGGPGHSHQAVRDVAALGGVPGLTVLAPSCEREVQLGVDHAVRSDESVYLRLESVPREVPFELAPDYRLVPGRGAELTEGDDGIVIAYGPLMLTQAWHAAAQVRAEGVAIKLVNLPWLNHVDGSWLEDLAGDARFVLTLENHHVVGGLGDRVAAVFAARGGTRARRVVCHGVESIPAFGVEDEVLRAHRLRSEDIVELLHRLSSAEQRA